MRERRSISVAELDSVGWALLSRTVRQLEQSWRENCEADVAEYVPASNHPLRQLVLLELVKVDQEYRWKSGQKKNVEEYLEEWPELKDEPDIVVELVEAECLNRTAWDVIPTIDEIRSRFSNVAESIDLEAIKAKVESELPGNRDTGVPLHSTDKATQAVNDFPGEKHRVPLLAEGQRFGRYEIRSMLGGGGMGTVYRAYDTELEIDIALKIPHPTADANVLDRFVREGRMLAKTRHPNICPIYDVGQVDGMHYISMGLIKGQTLSGWMKGREISCSDAVELVSKLAQALGTVHVAHVVHRDIKVSNVMIDEGGEPLLMDFGLARPTEGNSNLTSTDALVGTFPYMSPEQVSGEELDARSDLYSLGVLFYQLLTGELPFSGPIPKLLVKIVQSEPPRPRKLRPDLDPVLEAICLRAVARSPGRRFQLAKDMAEALQEYLTAAPGKVPPPSRRYKWIWGSAAASVVLLLAGMVIHLMTGEGTLVLSVNQPDVKVTIEGDEIQFKSPRDEMTVTVGQHRLRVSKDGFLTHTDSFSIRRGDQVELSVNLEPKPLTDVPEQPRPLPLACEVDRWIETDPTIGGICLSGDGSTLFVAYWEDDHHSRVQVFDVASGKVLRTVKLQNRHPHGDIVLSSDGRYLYTTNYYPRYITRIDLQDDNLLKNLDVGGIWASYLDITPNKQKLVVPLGQDGRPHDESNDALAIVDVANGKFCLVGRVQLADEPSGHKVGFSSDSEFAYVVTRPRKSSAATLYEIRLTPPCQVTRTLAIPGGELQSVAVSSKLQRAFVSDSAQRKIWVVDIKTFGPVTEFGLAGYAPGTLSIDVRNDLLIASCPATRGLLCVDARDGTILGRVAGLRQQVHDLEFSADRRLLFLSNQGPKGGVGVVTLSRLLNYIVFASDRAGESFQIYVMSIDGKQVARITDNHATERSPRWSPDRRRIAFISDRDGPARICIVNRDGTGASVLDKTGPMTGDLDAAVPLDWSPTGRSVVFVSRDGTAIRTVDVVTGEIRTLTHGAAAPGYSRHHGLCWRKADGHILFTSAHAAWSYHQEIFVMDPETRETRQITKKGEAGFHFMAPAASPDGTKIAAVQQMDKPPPPRNIVMLKADGTERTRVTKNDRVICAAPRWFPDGKKLVYSSRAGHRHDIYVIDAVGGKPSQITSGDANDIEPDVCGRVLVSEDSHLAKR